MLYLTEELGRVGVFQPIPRDFPRAEPEGNPEGWAGKPRLAQALLLGITFFFIKHFHSIQLSILYTILPYKKIIIEHEGISLLS